ncbi:MAG: glycosyltransferase family 39 protein [Oscillospiraceae bacterium]|jgi:4-amino-4-deoxy-L-arabinose transferase-like glycosyltransferase|nr:glycosyltransferase family 39 protein [Oscillospiraceae bacterium]
MASFFYNYSVYLLPAAALVLIAIYFIKYYKAEREHENENKQKPLPAPARFPKPFKLSRADAPILLLITAVYAVVAFTGLGDNAAPESLYRFTSDKREIVIDLGEERELLKVDYYTGNQHNEKGYNFSVSTDGYSWNEPVVMQQDHATTFHWLTLWTWIDSARYVKITALSAPMELGEISFSDSNGRLDPGGFLDTGGLSALFDEQELVPAESSYLNSAYFDEIYHARTAYEFLEGTRPYETTHPPLGKVLIGVGISIFGMNPFGWRFIGVLFGVLMVPVMYVFIKKLFGKTAVAVLGTLLFSFDFMHYVQTRISTIDTYGVFFTILMYFFMYLFVSSDFDGPFRKQLIPLALCGISFGLGIASKWTCFYAAIGLVAIYAIYIISQGRAYSRERRMGEYWRRLLKLLLASVLFFVAAAGAIYYFSYYLFARGMGEPLSLQLVWNNQIDMFKYHNGVTDSHPYESKWWMWIFDGRPILYYRSFGDGMTSSFASWQNPVVSWAGLISVAGLAVRLFMKKGDKLALFIVIGYLSQLVPWTLISRCTFAYHYFPSVIFLVLALCWTINRFMDIAPEKRKYSYALTGGAVGLFALFYPVLSGIYTANWYYRIFLAWFPSWPF